MSDLLSILKKRENVSGQTAGEILKALNEPDTAFYRQRLLKRLTVEIAQGSVEVAQAERIRIDKRPTRVPVYRLIQSQKKAAASKKAR